MYSMCLGSYETTYKTVSSCRRRNHLSKSLNAVMMRYFAIASRWIFKPSHVVNMQNENDHTYCFSENSLVWDNYYLSIFQCLPNHNIYRICVHFCLHVVVSDFPSVYRRHILQENLPERAWFCEILWTSWFSSRRLDVRERTWKMI